MNLKKLTQWKNTPANHTSAWVKQHISSQNPDTIWSLLLASIELNAVSALSALLPHVTPDVTNIKTRLILEHAAKHNSVPVFEHLCPVQPDPSAAAVLYDMLVLASPRRHVALVGWLMQCPQAPLIKIMFQKSGSDLIEHACHLGHADMMEQLLPWCTPNLVLGAPLYRAAKHGHSDVVAALIRVASASNKRQWQMLALRLALENADQPMIRVLWPASDPVDMVSCIKGVDDRIVFINQAQDHWSVSQLDQLLEQYGSLHWIKNCPVLMARQTRMELTNTCTAAPSSSRPVPKM